MPNGIEYGIATHLGHSNELPVKLGARSLHTKGRDDDPRICKMIASSFQDKYMSSSVLGEATGHGQARSAPSYDDKIIGRVQFCGRRRHDCLKNRGTGGSMKLSVVYNVTVIKI